MLSAVLLIIPSGKISVNVLTQALAAAPLVFNAVGAGATGHSRLTKKSFSKLSNLNGKPSLDPGNVKDGTLVFLTAALHPVHVKLIVALTATVASFCMHEITALVAANPV